MVAKASSSGQIVAVSGQNDSIWLFFVAGVFVALAFWGGYAVGRPAIAEREHQQVLEADAASYRQLMAAHRLSQTCKVVETELSVEAQDETLFSSQLGYMYSDNLGNSYTSTYRVPSTSELETPQRQVFTRVVEYTTMKCQRTVRQAQVAAKEDQ